MVKALIKKQFAEILSPFKACKKKTVPIGRVFSAIFYAVILAVTLTTFSFFLKIYSEVEFDGVTDVALRQYELLSIAYGFIFLFNVFCGIKALNKSLFESGNLNLFLVLPIKPSALLISNLLFVYLKQVFSAFLTVVPLNLVFYVVSPQGAGYIILTLLIPLFLPTAALAVASALALPIYFIKKFVEAKYLIGFILITALTALIYYGYAYVSAFLGDVVSGGTNAALNEKTMLIISGIARNAYPANAFAGILLNFAPAKNWAVFIGTVALGAAIGYPVSNLLFIAAGRERISEVRFKSIKSESVKKRRPQFIALMRKEFVTVFRTPSYAFSCFTMAAAMPLMIYLSLKIGGKTLSGLMAVRCDTQLALLLFLMFVVLTNTFCASNVSRDSTAFFLLKSMPCTPRRILSVKILFCSAISAVSIAVSAVVVSALGILNPLDTTFVFFVAFIAGEAEICFATRKDLNKPMFEINGLEQDETRAMPILIATGMTFALLLGGLSVYFAVIGAFNTSSGGKIIAYVLPSIGVVFLFIAALIYLLKGLNRKYLTVLEET